MRNHELFGETMVSQGVKAVPYTGSQVFVQSHDFPIDLVRDDRRQPDS